MVYTLLSLGETERAFGLLGPEPTSNDPLVFGTLFRDFWPDARRSPRFPELARQVGWAELWDREGAPDGCRKVGRDWVCSR